jgi:hypothetical protein
VTDTNPEDEIGFVKSPEHGPVVSGHTNAVVDLIEPGAESSRDNNSQHCGRNVELRRSLQYRTQQIFGE